MICVTDRKRWNQHSICSLRDLPHSYHYLLSVCSLPRLWCTLGFGCVCRHHRYCHILQSYSKHLTLRHLENKPTRQKCTHGKPPKVSIFSVPLPLPITSLPQNSSVVVAGATVVVVWTSVVVVSTSLVVVWTSLVHPNANKSLASNDTDRRSRKNICEMPEKSLNTLAPMQTHCWSSPGESSNLCCNIKNYLFTINWYMIHIQ